MTLTVPVLPGLFHGFGRPRSAGRTNGHHQFEIGISAEERGGFALGFVLQIIARTHGDEFHLGIFIREARFDVLAPFVHVCGGERGGDDGKLAFFTGESRGFIHQRIADAFGRRLIHEKCARIRSGVRIIGEHLDALLLRFAQCCRDALLVLAGSGDAIHANGDPILDDFVLPGGVGIQSARRKAVPTPNSFAA